MEMEPSNAGAHRRRCLDWMEAQGEGFKAFPRVSGRQRSLPIASWLQPAGLGNPASKCSGKGAGEWVVGSPALGSRVCDCYCRRISSKSYLAEAGPPARPVSAWRVSPQALLAAPGKTHARFAPRPWLGKTLGAARTRSVFRKPPLQASCGKAAAPQPDDRHASPEEGRRP